MSTALSIILLLEWLYPVSAMYSACNRVICDKVQFMRFRFKFHLSLFALIYGLYFFLDKMLKKVPLNFEGCFQLFAPSHKEKRRKVKLDLIALSAGSNIIFFRFNSAQEAWPKVINRKFFIWKFLATVETLFLVTLVNIRARSLGLFVAHQSSFPIITTHIIHTFSLLIKSHHQVFSLKKACK